MNTLTIIGLVGIAALVAANVAPGLVAKLKAAKAKSENVETVPWSSDDPPFKEAFIAEVKRIVASCGGVEPESFILKHLNLDSSDSDIMADRVKKLEDRLKPTEANPA